ncbi:amino acid adenylation domain-containing protein [Streptomyces sp. NBC_00090]|uniref:amino acid adenylation domain-containing protein n=1 Tax=Streptomyces sp. NBC_00090 TaxID=2903619 RepID=UPI0032547721
MTIQETTPAQQAGAPRADRPASPEELRAELLRSRLAGRRGPRGGPAGPPAPAPTSIPRADRAAPLLLSAGQQQMWFLNRLEPDSAEYLVPMVLRLRGALDTAALAAAWQAVTDRHEILRTRYGLSGVEPVQLVDAPAPVALPLEDLSGEPRDGREALAAELVERELATPFDLAAQWPARAGLIRLAEDEHILAVTFHHIACDAWSTRIFAGELSTLYTRRAAGDTTPLPPLEIQYADYAAWQRRQLPGPLLERHLAHWRERLAGALPVELPTDRPRPVVRDTAGADVPVTFPDGLAGRIRALAVAHGTTPFAVLLTAFQVLVARYTGQNDVSVGTVVSGRVRPELQQLIGYGINTLVMRGSWADDPGFGELLTRTRTAMLDAFDHQEVPFARLVDELQPERDMSRTPLHQVAFTLHEQRLDAFALPGLTVEQYARRDRVAKYELTLQIEEGPDGSLGGALNHATALFDRATAERMAGHLTRLLEAATADPALPVSRLRILGDAELAVATGSLSGSRAGAPVDRCVHQAFEEQAAATPDAVAVTSGTSHLTYRELNERANRVAHQLRAMGAGPEQLVGLCLERDAELLPALLGILKSGAGYLPLDPANPADRLAYVTADAGARIVVGSERTAPALADAHGVETLLVDRDASLVAARPATNPEPLAGPGSTVYVIYTSGSTGRPKGVVLEHGNVLRLLTTAHEHYGFTAEDVWTMFHSYAFDVSVFEMWGALLYGGRLVVVGQDVTRAPSDFLDLLVAERATVLSQTPTAFRSLIAAAGSGDPRIDRLSLRAVVFAGEKLEVSELRPWLDRVGPDGPALVNMYGITETTVHTTYHRIEEADCEPLAGNRVGHPLSDLSVYLLDGSGNPAPIGVPGEIHVGGPGVARGYLGRPELTAERFVPDPFGPPGARLYRSGDAARRLPDGSLEFIGRIDDQVKIRGYRVELGEIAHALLEHPGVGEAVVRVRTDSGEKQLVGYLVEQAPGSLPDPGELRTLLRRTLPEYMLPAAFVPLDRIPLTVNGKLDHRALPAPDTTTLRGARAYTAPRTPVEERVAAVWTEVLGVDRVGVEDSFFDLGGDSIRAIALVGALRAAGYDVSVRDVFDFRTVARLCESITGRPALAPGTETVEPFALIDAADRAAVPAGIVDAYPLSQMQLGMVVEMLADTSRNLYHNVSTFRIRDEWPFDPEAFAEAGRIVTARHEVLRTSIALTGYSRPMQLVHAEAEMPLGRQDLRGLDAAAVDGALRAFTAEERGRVFDLAVPSLMRFHAHLTDDDTGWWISVTECHPILEGWGHHSLLMELIEVYRAVRDGLEPEAFDAPAVRFADFVAGELRAVDSAEDRAYWQEVVTEHAPLRLPQGWGDSPGTPRETVQAGIVWTDLEEGLRALAARAKTSLKSVMVAAHLAVMGRLTEEEAFHTGLVCDARPELLGADRVLGMYLNTLPFAHDRSARTWDELVRQVFAREVGLWDHRRYPMAAIQREWGGSRRLLDVYFNYQDFRQVDSGLVDHEGGIDDSPSEFPLTVSSRVGHIIVTCDSHTVNRANAERLVGMYRRVLEAMAADPDGDATVDLLSDEERRLLLTGDYDTAVPRGPATAYDLFAERAAAAPDAVALLWGGREYSYGWLLERSERYGRRLHALGTGPESVVGLLLDRTPELVAAMLGTWRTGASYVPLDPAFPADRIGYVLADAGAGPVVTEPAFAAVLDGVHDGPRLVHDLPGDEHPAATPPVRAEASHLAYTLYTSGSTGRPKGVGIAHAALANLLLAMAERLGSTGADTWLSLTSVSFDISGLELFLPLVTGGRLVLADSLDTKDGAALTRLVERHGISHAQATPSGWNLLLRSGFERSAITALTGGEALPAELAGELRARVGRLVNVYGPTETTIWSTSWDVPGDADRISIGRPIANNTVYVLDARLRPVPAGVAGQLYIGGDGLARGYRNLPARTAEFFGPDPFSDVPGARMYRTGDVVRTRPDGTLLYIGRADDQVKIRGVRIEPGEIEAALMTLPGVAHTAVAVREDTPGDKRLVAYVVPAGPEAPEPGALRRRLATLLPEAMLPSAFVTLEALPLNTAGKIDRKALPAPEGDALAADDYLAPRTPAEERMAALWAEVLGADRVGVQDSFFGLGGDSLRAVNLVGALRAAGYDLAVRDVFEQRTVAGLAEAAAGRPVLTGGITAVAPFALIEPDDRQLVPAGVADAYPASQLQLGMLVEMLADTDGATYHQCVSIRVNDDKPFREDALRQAVADVTARHDVLRTSFDLTGFSQPMQLVHESVDIPVRVHDLRGRDEAARSAALDAFLAAERADGFDPARAPLLRVAVHLESDAAWRVTFSQPHAITQGWGQFSLVTELVDRYREIRDGRGHNTGHQAPPIRYADFVAGELESLSQGVDSAFWKGVTHGYAPLRIPAGWGEPGDRRTHVVPVDLADLEEPLRAFASRGRVSLKSVLLAAHLKVMSQLTEEEAFHTGLVCDARPEVLGSDRVLGMYLNTLPFAHDRSARTWDELVRQVFAREVGLWGHRRYPMAAIQREAPGAQRQIDVLFNYHDLRIFGSDRIDAGSSVGQTTTEFALTVATGGQGLHLTAESQVLSRANGERLARMYRAVLASMASSPTGDPRLTYLGELEEERLRSFTETGREPSWVAVEEELDRYAAEAPGRTALTADGVELSYAEVAAESNRLAHHLRALGVGPDTVVALHAHRSPATVLAVLAVLKAGGAWLPLDPALPAERLAYMARDAHAAVLLSDPALSDPALHGLDLTAVPLDRPETWAHHPATAPAPVADPDHLAYVIYTSGSTGRPKGVQVTRRGMANHLLAKVEDLELTGADSVVQNASMSFDISVWQILVAFVVGGRVRVVDETAAVDPAALFGRTADERITVLEVVPSLLRAALDAWDAGPTTPGLPGLPGLRWMVVTGEALPPDLCRRWFARFPEIPMVNAYGPTECSDDITHAVVRAGDPVGGARVTIGRPVRNTRLYVLDQAMAPVPVGVPGELYAGGTGVSRGYGGRPALTAERFLPDPFGPDGSRLYRTGDVAAWNEDGSIEFLGRVDHQVKVRGVRIELGEIEAALTALESVVDAAVAVRRGPLGHEQLIGYVVTADGAAPDPATLRERLARTLPEAMIPAGYVTLPVLPLTPNGKVDRKALPEPAEWSAAGDRPCTEPATDTERRIAAIWSQTLGIARIGREDGFFRLGGDSILVIRVIAAGRRAGLDISLFLLYKHDTLAALAAALDAAAVTAAAARTPLRPAAEPAFDPRTVREALAADGVPGASLAVIEGGELVALEGIGTLGADSDEPVTPDTLFQAGSWGKHVTAVAVLRLVDQGVLDLDADADTYLRTWRLPDTERPVTVRHLLSHLGGLAETPRRAVPKGRPVPALVELLREGAVPERPAGQEFHKSNAHYSVLEQLLTDVTGEPFEALMRRLVLDPLGMTGSSFDQSFPDRSGRPVALGHDEEGRTLEGGWLIHPELAAAGLWSTAADMARFELELRRSYLGRPLALLSRESARRMLTPHSDGFYGLGTIVDAGGAEVEYGHGGSPGGYQAISMNRLHHGSGVVVLTNGEFSERVLKAVGVDR